MAAIVVLSGGVGGARFLRGVVEVVEPSELTVVGNVGDDIEVLGVHVSPDLDSILYALAGLADEERGWGRADETWNALETVEALGGDAWFRLGDRDLGLHLLRTEALRAGQPLSAVTARVARALGLELALVPATDDRLRTWIDTPAGSFPFQEWFVARAHQDEVDAVRYEGAETARAAPGVAAAIDTAELIVIAPSNPYVSIGPILAVRQVASQLKRRSVPCVAVSPLIGGRAIKGPPAHVASVYRGMIDALVVDEADAHRLDGLDVQPIVTRTLMSDADARRRLAEAALSATAALR
jgi:LPPG:FO 2-phospho-L-lactate transferase